MKRKTKLLLTGMGSVMDISPDVSKLLRLIPRHNANERMRMAWNSTGRQISVAIDEFSNEQKKKSTASNK